MTYATMRSASALYRQTSAQGRVEVADRHCLIGMLYDGLVDRINQAAGHIRHGDVAAKGESFAKAIAIVGELRESLDHGVDPALTGRLDALYNYLTQRLLHAQLNDDLHVLNACLHLIEPLREAWQGIRAEYLAGKD